MSATVQEAPNKNSWKEKKNGNFNKCIYQAVDLKQVGRGEPVGHFFLFLIYQPRLRCLAQKPDFQEEFRWHLQCRVQCRTHLCCPRIYYVRLRQTILFSNRESLPNPTLTTPVPSPTAEPFWTLPLPAPPAVAFPFWALFSTFHTVQGISKHLVFVHTIQRW